LCIVDSINLLGILSLIGRYKKGKHLGHPAIHYHRVRSGYIETADSHPLLGNIDGEQFEKTGLSCEIRPSSLNFVFL
jgi:diacylglycerol kinase family enzyme